MDSATVRRAVKDEASRARAMMRECAEKGGNIELAKREGIAAIEGAYRQARLAYAGARGQRLMEWQSITAMKVETCTNLQAYAKRWG